MCKSRSGKLKSQTAKKDNPWAILTRKKMPAFASRCRCFEFNRSSYLRIWALRKCSEKLTRGLRFEDVASMPVHEEYEDIVTTELLHKVYDAVGIEY